MYCELHGYEIFISRVTCKLHGGRDSSSSECLAFPEVSTTLYDITVHSGMDAGTKKGRRVEPAGWRPLGGSHRYLRSHPSMRVT